MAVLALCGALLLAAVALRIATTLGDALVEGDDFTPYWNGATSVVAGRSPYAWLAENRLQEGRDYIYPPPLALALAPFAWALDYPTARWAWLGFTTLCIVASGVLIWRTSGLRLRSPPVPGGAKGSAALALVAFVGLLPATTSALSSGTLSPVLLLGVAGAYAALGARRPGAAGACLAVVGYLKSFPSLLGGYLLLRGQWVGVLTAAGTGLLLVAWTLLALGWEPHWAYFAGVVPAQRLWLGAASNASITGVFTRLLADNPFTTPLGVPDGVSPAAIVLTTAALLGATAYAIWRVRPDWEGESAAFGLAVVATLLVSPINGHGNLVIAALPLAVAAARVQADWPRHLRWLLLVALLLSLPVEFGDLAPVRALYLSDFPDLPVNALPWRVGWGNLLIDGPFFGLVALWALLLRLCLEPSGARPRASQVVARARE